MTHRTVGLSFSAYAESTVHAEKGRETKRRGCQLQLIDASVTVTGRESESESEREMKARVKTKVKECK